MYIVMIWIGFILVFISQRPTDPIMGYAMMATGLLGAFVGSLMISFPSTKHQAPPAEETPAEELLPHKIIMKIIVSDNRTGEKMEYISENDFGLDWQTFEEDNLIKIVQRLSHYSYSNILDDEAHWHVIALLLDYSITRVVWKLIDAQTDPVLLTDAENTNSIAE